MREAAPSQGCPRCPRWLAAATVLQGIAATVLLLLVVIQPTTVVVQSLQPTALPQGFAALISPSGPAVTEPQAQMRGPPAAAAQSEAATAAKRYAYGVEAPLELPSPPPPEPAMPAASAGCSADRRYDRYLASRQWTAAEMAVVKGIVNASAPTSKPATFHGYVCYQHRNVSDDPPRQGCADASGAGAARRSERCRAREPTFPTPAGTCLCCPMKGHVCPPCWGCLMPLSRRRAFGGKLYRRRAVER